MRIVETLLLACLLGGASACGATREFAEITPLEASALVSERDVPRADAREPTRVPQRPGEAHVAGHSVGGRPIEYHVLGAGPRRVLLLATIHGDEAAGTPLLQRLIEHLHSHPEARAGRQVVIVPVLNPDGFAAERRYNARGVDLNRNFPAANRKRSARYGEALSEPESRALHELITRHPPDVVVSLHGWVGQIDWDGPADELALRMGSRCGLPAKQIGANPGSLGSFLGVDGGLPVITFELPHAARKLDDDALWERFGPALLSAVSWSGPTTTQG